MDIGFGVAWVLLGVGCVFDLINGRLPLLFLTIGGVAGGILALVEGISSAELFYALLPGGVMAFVSFISGEKIGYGDGLILMALGLLEGGDQCIWDMGIGILLAAIFGVGMLIFKKARCDARIPFVPFLLVAHTIQFMVGV